MGISLINHPLWGTSIHGNPHFNIQKHLEINSLSISIRLSTCSSRGFFHHLQGKISNGHNNDRTSKNVQEINDRAIPTMNPTLIVSLRQLRPKKCDNTSSIETDPGKSSTNSFFLHKYSSIWRQLCGKITWNRWEVRLTHPFQALLGLGF